MAGARVEYREAGAAVREAVARLPADATGLQARVLLALVALVSSWSRRSDDVHLDAIAEQVYGIPGEPFTATRPQKSRLGRVLVELADLGVIELERPGKGRPPSDRRPYYRVTFPAAAPQDRENASPQGRVTRENASPQGAERVPPGTRNASPQGAPYEKDEKYSEEGPAPAEGIAALLDPSARRQEDLLREAWDIERQLVDRYGRDDTDRAIADAHRRGIKARWPTSELRPTLEATANRLKAEHAAERSARTAACTTCEGTGYYLDDHNTAHRCPDCATEAVA